MYQIWLAVRVRNSLVWRLKAHRSKVCGLKWSITGNLLASGVDDNVVYIWEASRMNSVQFVYRFKNHVAAVKAQAWCPYNFEVLASGGGTNDGCIKLWDTQQGTYINSVNTEAQIRDRSLFSCSRRDNDDAFCRRHKWGEATL
ncbi:putative transcription factor WD40-like family [Helianthus annuus]|nr:putative transcription factor WD40-like family [Helianthus annuus]KAJ0634027.1 putative transcription factor WD40-like family [Helianthus annuus]